MSLNVQHLLTNHIDLWTSAIENKSSAGRGSSRKQTLYGIKKLRELILELAVRGKLVPQDPNDEPASELLKRIEAERDQLVKEGKIKKPKKLPEISDEEKPFELPEGWSLIRLGELLQVLNGRAYKKSEMLNTGTPILRVGNLFTSNEWYYSDLSLEPEKYIDKGDLIYAWSASFGPFIWTGRKVIYHYHIWKLDIFDEESSNKEFLYNYLLAITKQIKASGNGIAMLHMTKERMEKLVIPLPTKQEQHRIVAKVDELMALCDQLEQQTEQQLDAHQQLVDSLLDTLIQSQNADELADNWTRLSEHFDTLFTTEASIDQLKQTILQLAVMGKLVPQNPNDEPASELLKRIAAEKAQLIKDGKIKKQKPLPPISEEEKPFELPEGWEWVRLGIMINLVSGQHLKPDEYSETDSNNAVPYITGPAEFGEVSPSYSKYTFEKRALSKVGDILVTCKGSGLGKANISNCTLAISRQLMALQPILIETTYIKLLVDSLYQHFQSKGVGIAIPGISREDILEITVPFAPLAEQNRIVTQINELFTLCNQLKERLTQSQQTQLQLTDTLVTEALNG